MEKSSSLSRSNMVQTVLKKIRNDIILYHYKDGTQIKEVDLTQKYHCSRSAIRSVFIILEKEGLINARENGTKFVSCLNREDINNLYNLRRYIELTAIRQFFDKKSNDISILLNVVNEVRNADHLDKNQILEIDTDFHTAIIKISHNKPLLQAWINISDVLSEVFTLNMTESEEYERWFYETFKERHIELFTAMMSDKTKSVELLEKHIEDARVISLKAAARYES